MIKILILSFFLGFSLSAKAEDKEIMKSVLKGIDITLPVLNEARKNADRQDRFRFLYSYLRSDLNVIKQGIRSAIWGKETKNYVSINLHGDYGFVGKTQEARYLQMFVNEIQFLKSEIEKAKSYQESNGYEIRKVNYDFIISDFDSVIGKIQNALSGSGDHARRYPAIRGGNW